MIDLHSHTTASDGTYTPAELIRAAVELPLDALAITDHDTLNGYLEALPLAEEAGLRLICGVELSTKLTLPDGYRSKTAHLLGYWPTNRPAPSFVAYLDSIQQSRRDRNRRLVERLNESGIEITLAEVEQLGRSITGRPHFARVLVSKGYAASIPDAFARYLGEDAPAYVERESPPIEEAIRSIVESGGIASLAHPIRLSIRDLETERETVKDLAGEGLNAIECYHSDHGREEVERYLGYARALQLRVTGGSDFHGGNKPDVALGTGRGNVSVPTSLLTQLE